MIDYLSHDWTDRGFIIVCVSVGWFLPLGIITFSYVGIVRATKESQKALQLLTEKDGGPYSKHTLVEKRKAGEFDVPWLTLSPID